MRTFGASADPVTALGWTLTIIALAVTVVVGVLIVIAALRHRTAAAARTERGAEGPVTRTGTDSAVRWIVIGGIIIPAIIIVFSLVYTVVTMSAIAEPSRKPAFSIEIVGHRWWWEARYHVGGPDRAMVTANEIHLPVGVPVRLDLTSADVIHSFWVPQLAGKIDVIPGQRSTTWIEPTRAGVYRGQCAEYCGLQHAHMALYVIAQPEGQFRQWLAAQAQPAQPPRDSLEAAGLAVFERSACAACHTIRDTATVGKLGPDLTHLASRRTIGAGLLPNTRGNLAGWIANSQALKPGNLMPPMNVPPKDLQVLITYLEGLR
jgi:cytochrome c oxidase subunit 2